MGTPAVATHLDDVQTNIPRLGVNETQKYVCYRDENLNKIAMCSVAKCDFPEQVFMSECDEEEHMTCVNM